MAVDRTQKIKVETPAGVWNPQQVPVIAGAGQAAIPKAKPAQAQAKTDEFNWMPWATALGGGLLLHTIASSLMDRKSDDEKRRESIWERLLSTIIPIGVGGLGMYGGYRLGNLMKSGAAPTVTNDWVTVTSPKGGRALVPDDYADQMDALFKYLPDNHGGNITLDDIDAARENLRSASEADQGLGGSVVRGTEKATTMVQPVLYGVGGAKAGYGAWQMFANRPGAVKNVANAADQAVKANARSVQFQKKKPIDAQQEAAVANGFASPKAFRKGVAARNAEILRGAAEFGEKAPGKMLNGAKTMAKSLYWLLPGLGVSALDSYLEDLVAAAKQRQDEAEYWRQNGAKVRAILNGSTIVPPPDDKK